MTRLRSWAWTLIVPALIWAVLSWPLPRYAGRGIPMSSQNIERQSARAMIPGDHLQLLYHFQLVEDFLEGRIPFFHNVYEFNTGRDEDRYQPGSYYAPFSLAYAALARVLPAAGAWNGVGFLSLWATFAATLAYLRNFTRSSAAAWLGAIISILLPYRWVNLLGGSPSGFAMVWPPVIVWLMDRAIRNGRTRDGVFCGIALLLACWGDLQAFFFATLSLPFWALLSAADAGWLRRPFPWAEVRARIPAALAAAAGLAAAAAYRWMRHAHLAGSEMAGGRDFTEVLAFSPSVAGFWQWRAEGLQSHVYLGVTTVLVFAGLILALRRAPGTADVRPARRIIPWLTLLALLAVMVLALGLRGPFHGAALRALRILIPPYAMVRQTAKIFTLMPTLLALGAALAADRLCSGAGRRARGPMFALAAALTVALVEYPAQVRATICLLDSGQSAYARVAEDARKHGHTNPHALALPLWPGEAAESSVYQYYARQHGLRLVNGYSPVVSRAYVEEVFQPLQAINQGDLTEASLAQLESMNVSHLLLHEDMFPEKVSPFPVSWTRDRLLAHPRLTWISRDGAVWAFRIEPRPVPQPAPRSVPVRFPARRVAFDRLEGASERVADPGCAGGAFRALRPGEPPLSGGPWRVAAESRLAWLLRVRGAGTLVARTGAPTGSGEESRIPVTSTDWTWLRIPIRAWASYGPMTVRVHAEDGRIDADTGWLIAGDWNPAMAPGEIREFAPADFFHAGWSSPEDQSVTFRPDRDPADAILYGPRLPLEPGVYELEWTFIADAPHGTPLGEVNLRAPTGSGSSAGTPVVSGMPAILRWDQTDNSSAEWTFTFFRTAPARLERVRLIRRDHERTATEPTGLRE